MDDSITEFVRLSDSDCSQNTSLTQLNTVNDRIPDNPVFKWSFSGNFLCPFFERSGIQMPGSTILIKFLNGLSWTALL
jgi:hypothetical protein